MNRAVQCGPRLVAIHALDDHADVAHRPADEAALPRPGRRRAFADDVDLLADMVLLPAIMDNYAFTNICVTIMSHRKIVDQFFIAAVDRENLQSK